MKTFLKALVGTSMWILAVTVASGATNEVNWFSNVSAARQSARQLQRPVFLSFGADWCVPCHLMEVTFKNPDVVQKLNSFVAVKIDTETEKGIAKQFEVSAIPTFVILSPDGNEVTRFSGAMGPRDFGVWLNGGMAIAAFTAARANILADTEKRVGADLKSADPEVRRATVARLVEDQLKRHNDFQQLAADRLKMVASESPVLLLDYLNDPRLAVRIAIGNIMRQKVGQRFVYDPWASPAKRQEVINWWKEHFTATVALKP